MSYIHEEVYPLVVTPLLVGPIIVAPVIIAKTRFYDESCGGCHSSGRSTSGSSSGSDSD